MTSSTPSPAFSTAELRNGFEACTRNALKLLATAQKCVSPSESKLWQENHALGLSLAVLALEEIAKFCLIDATLFSFENDDVVKDVRRKHIQHKSKLEYLQIWPLILRHIVDHSGRAPEDKAHMLEFAASIARCKAITTKMEKWIPGPDFTLLDQWKQRGFYVGLVDDRFQTPSDAITRERAEEVVTFAHAVVGATALYGLHNIDGYLGWASGIRGLLTPEAINQLRKVLRDARNETRES